MEENKGLENADLQGAETPVIEGKTYKYKLDTDKSSGVGLKNGKLFNIVNKNMELTEQEVVENLAVIKKGLIVFVGPANQNPLKNVELLNQAKGAVTKSLEIDTLRVSLAKELEETQDKMKESIAGYEKTIAEQKKEITKLTKENKELIVENDKLQKDLKAAK